MSKTAQAIKSGVVMGGTAILSAVNGLTPHMAGAIDIMVVQQPDGSLKCSPFYVRFGKYTPMRSKDKKVQIFVNGEEACFNMHLGAYGQAYFAAETMEIVSDADDELLTGMMSPSSGYSSDDDDSSTPYANASMLSAVQQEVQRLKAAQAAADAQEAAAAGTPSAMAAAAGAEPEGGLSGAGGSVPEPGSVDEASGVQAEASGSVSAAGGGVQGLEVSSSSGPRPSQGSTLSGSESDEESSSSSSSFSDLPSPAEVAQALRQGLEAGAGHHGVITNAAHNGADGHHQQQQQQQLAIPPGLAPIATVSSNGNTSGSGSSKRRSRKHHLAKRVLQVSGDGAADDPARSHLQDLLLDNRYSIKMQSDASFVAAGRQHDADAAAAAAQPQQQRSRSRSPLQHSRHTRQEQQQQQPQMQAVQQLEDTHPQREPQQQQQQQQVVPVRHVGFQLPSSPEQPPSHKSIGPAAHAAAAAGAAAANGHLPRVHAADLPVLLDSSASYSVDEVSEATGASRTASTTADADSSGVVDGPAAAGAAAAAEETVAAAAAPGESPFIASRSASMEAQPTLADGLQDAGAGVASQALPVGPRGQPLDFPMVQRQQQQLQQQGEEGEGESEGVISPGRGRDSLLSSSLKAQQQQQKQQEQQQEQEQQGPVDLQQEQHSVHQRLAELQSVQPSLPQQQQQSQQQRPQVAEQQTRGALSATSADAATAAAATPPPPPLAAAAAGEAGDDEVDRSPSAASSQDVDATAILDEPAAVATTDWATTQAVPPPPPAAAAEAGTPPADVPTTPAAVRSDPVSMPAPFAASPPVDSGYLGDSEAGALLGTSYEGATPRRGAAAAAAAAMSAEGVSGLGAGPLALGLVGFQLSLCGDLLRPGIAAAEAQQVFETRRVSGDVWCERGVSLMADPNLVVRIGGNLYSWQVAAPMVVGMLAFGGKWDNLLGLDDTGLYPIKVAEDHTGHTAKKSSSSWRLWPFIGWREPSGSSSRQQPGGQQQQQQQVVPGTSPVAGPLPPAAAAASGSASAALQPSGGSFNNLKALLGPGSKSAPGRAGDYSGVGAGAGGVDGSVGGVVGVDGAAGRTGSFMSTGSSPPRVSRKKHIILIRKTLTPTSDQLSLLPLKPGANTITFRAGGAADLTAYIYLLRWNTRLVVSDVDGTITRSDLLGHVLPTLGVDWSHPGITQLFHNIARNGYQIMFLSSRAIAQANITREYLHTLVQNDFKMPSGPVIISPHGLLPSLYREIVVRRPHEFKIACLQDIRALFPAEWNPFYAGFGNRDTDEVAYREVGVPLSRTFTINPKGQIQKASTAVQSSTWSSLSAINDLVDEMFPGLLQHSSSSLNTRGLQSVYTSFNDTLELAAAIGAIEHEAAAALFAEQQRRRSSSSGGGAADGAKARAAAAAAAGGGSVDGSSGEQHLAGADGPAAAADGDGGGDGVVGAVLSGRPLTPENVGPAREEYNDLHFWRPSLSVDIQDELAEFTVKQTQPVS